jgi:hypothetical protein
MALKQYIDDAHSVAAALEIYAEKLNTTGFSGSFPYLNDKIQSNIKYVKSSKKVSTAAQALEKKPDLESSFLFYSEIMKMRRLLIETADVFAEHKVNPLQEGSQTSSGSTITYVIIDDIINTLTDLQDIMENFMPPGTIDTLTSLIGEMALTGMQSDDASTVTSVTNEYEKYRDKSDVILLYQSIMKNLIEVNTGTEKGSKIVKKIMKLMEKLKTSSLICPRVGIIGNKNKKSNTVQRLVQMNNLVPSIKSGPFKDIVKELTGVKVSGEDKRSIDNACKIASSVDRKIGFVVIRKISTNPMKHVIASLIDKEYVIRTGNFQSADAGINAKLYERTKTIIPLDAVPGKGDNIDVYDNEHTGGGGSGSDYDFFYILETLDGSTYRILHPWDAGASNLATPAAWVKNMPVYDKSPSIRVSGYNELLNDSIMVHLQEPLAGIDFMSREEARKADIKWKNIRENILRVVREEFSSKLSVGSKKGLGALLASPKLHSSILLEIVKQLEATDQQKAVAADVTDVYYEELSVSYLKDLQAMQAKLGRELTNVYQSDYADIRDINKAFNGVMGDVLAKIINNKSNIFITIKYKSELLQKTLLKE